MGGKEGGKDAKEEEGGGGGGGLGDGKGGLLEEIYNVENAQGDKEGRINMGRGEHKGRGEGFRNT